MSNKAPKLTIEIEDLNNGNQCVAAIRKLFGALRDHRGFDDANRLWMFYREAPPVDQRERSRLRLACFSFDYDDLRLILEYYAMDRPNKEKLARDLARKNETLPEEKRYPVKSAEDPAGAILQQIKRAFRFDGEACRIIGEAPDYLRREQLKEVEDARLRMLELKRQSKSRLSLPRVRRITIRQRLNGTKYGWILDSNGRKKRA
jgi:hypothetical protein